MNHRLADQYVTTTLITKPLPEFVPSPLTDEDKSLLFSVRTALAQGATCAETMGLRAISTHLRKIAKGFDDLLIRQGVIVGDFQFMPLPSPLASSSWGNNIKVTYGTGDEIPFLGY
jgi:hypothetical protein